MLVAEAIFLAIDRKVWHYDLSAETYRLIDLGVMVALVVGGVVLPVVLRGIGAGGASSTWWSPWPGWAGRSDSCCSGSAS